MNCAISRFGGIKLKQAYYLFQNGNLKRKDNTLEVAIENGEKRSIPVERVSDLYIFGEMNFNSKLLDFLSHKGICLHLFNYYSFYSGSFYPRERLVSGFLLVNQVKHYEDNEKRIELAKAFIEGAAYNIYRNLRYYNERGKDVSKQMNEIKFLQDKLPFCKDVTELMGVEGNIHKIYYSAWNTIVDQEIDFEKRVKRPPDNMINTLISYVNTLIYTRVLSEIYHTQLNPTISYLHEPGVKRFSLSLDIAEIFKPLLGDRIIFSLLNKNQITEKDFEKELDFLYIKDSATKLITQEFDKRLKQTIKHKTLGREVSYQHLIRLECYKLVNHITGDKEYSPFKIWW